MYNGWDDWKFMETGVDVRNGSIKLLVVRGSEGESGGEKVSV